MTSITRVTQRMLTQRSLTSVDGSLAKMSAAQEQMTTGRRINRPSDDPIGAATAMRARAQIAEQQQYQRNGQDGLAWLSITDTALKSMTNQVQRAYTLALQGANSGSNGQAAQDALAAEIDQIGQDGGQAYAADPTTGIVTYVGGAGAVSRRVGAGTDVQVSTNGVDVFGTVSTDGTTSGDSVFDHLQALSTALTTGNDSNVQTAIANLQGDLKRMSAATANEGARYNQIATANDTAAAAVLSLQKTQSDAEDVDIAQATINVATQQTAYQAALAATSKTIQPSLLDFLR
jgi:flagellar hook-associated protein 3 FlgL